MNAGELKKQDTRQKSIDMLNGPLLGKIIIFTIPLIITNCIQQFFNSFDAVAAGQFVSNEALAAVGSTAPIINLIVNTFVGLSIGANVVVASQIAHGEDARIREATHTSMMVAIICGIGLLLLGPALAHPMLDLIDTPTEVMDPATSYLVIYFLGSPFILIYNFGAAVIRAKGNTRSPLYALIVACLINVVLDVLFTSALFPWGIMGIAAATSISYAVAAVIIIVLMMRDPGTTHLDIKQLKVTRAPLITLLKIGVPAGIQGAVFALSNLIIQGAINGFGADAMAGSTAALNLEVYVYYVMTAFAQTAVTFTSQNYALKKIGRCKRIFIICMAAGFGVSALICLAYVFFMEPLLGLFATEASAMAYAITRVWRVAIMEFIPTFYEIPAGALRGMNRSVLPSAIIIAGTCILRVFWVFVVFPANPTFDNLMLIYAVSWSLTSIVMMIVYAVVIYRIDHGKTLKPKNRTGAFPKTHKHFGRAVK